jgi:hypothetical protein
MPSNVKRMRRQSGRAERKGCGGTHPRILPWKPAFSEFTVKPVSLARGLLARYTIRAIDVISFATGFEKVSKYPDGVRVTHFPPN